MILETATKLVAVPGLIGLNAFFVAAEYALVSLRGSQISELVRLNRKGAKTLRKLRADLASAIAAIQVCITLTNLLLGWIAEPQMTAVVNAVIELLPLNLMLSDSVLHAVATGLGFVTVTLLTVVFGELLPKALTLQHTVVIGLWVAEPIRIVSLVFRPLVRLMNGLGNVVCHLCGLGAVKIEEHVHSADELELLVDESQLAGKFEEEHGRILQRVFDAVDYKVSDVMIPTSKVAVLNLGMGRDEINDIVLSQPHARWPVAAAPGGKIIGLAGAKHLLYMNTMEDLLTLEDVVVPVPSVRDNANLVDALRFLRRNNTHLAVVVDAGGEQRGVVTLEDLLSAVVGRLPTEPIVIDGTTQGG